MIPVTSDQSPASLFSVLHTMQVTHNSAEEPTPGDGRVHKERMERATDDETKTQGKRMRGLRDFYKETLTKLVSAPAVYPQFLFSQFRNIQKTDSIGSREGVRD